MRNRPLLFCFTCDISKKKILALTLRVGFFRQDVCWFTARKNVSLQDQYLVNRAESGQK